MHPLDSRYSNIFEHKLIMITAYEILGIPNDASETIVKKAYRDLARKFHPDKGGTEEEFRKINDAYSQIMKGENPMDTFPELSELFKVFSSFIKGPVIKTILELTLEELQEGGTHTVYYTHSMYAMEPETIKKTYTTQVDIPCCYDTRNPIRIKNVLTKDIEISVIIKDHPVYKRINGTLDLEMRLDITLKEALTGFTKEINLLNSSKPTRIECSSIVNPYTSKCVNGYGLQTNTESGDLYIYFTIQFPVIIDDETTRIIKTLEF